MNPAQIIDLIATALASKVNVEIDIHIRIGGKPKDGEED
jgi:hypothetical protein